ncbi:MAG: GFA family protein [Pseudomonadota bacterium]
MSQATEIAVAGGCYCGALRYRTALDGKVAGQCHCRACQHIAGGGPQYFHLVSPENFRWTRGAPAQFALSTLEAPVTRWFCATCGTHILTERQDQRALVLKVGTRDDPSGFTPQVAICFEDAQPFHTVAQGIPTFDGIPRGR